MTSQPLNVEIEKDENTSLTDTSPRLSPMTSPILRKYQSIPIELSHKIPISLLVMVVLTGTLFLVELVVGIISIITVVLVLVLLILLLVY